MPKWDPRVPLPEKTPWVLEASAGTGKTFQIAALVARLVAEHGLPIERILAITFTEAATAELRGRVRARLVETLAALRSSDVGAEDEQLDALLRSSEPSREDKAARVEVALRDFDLAPISTIHAFSRRMLAELSFESGQDAELELLTDEAALRDQLVDDALAALYARADATEVRIHRAAGYERRTLRKVVESLCDATALEVVRVGEAQDEEAAGPEVAGAEVAGAERSWAQAREYVAEVRAMAARFDADTRDPRLVALLGARDQVNRGGDLAERAVAVAAWLRRGGLARELTGKTETSVKRFASGELKEKKGVAPPFQERPWWSFVLEYDAFRVRHDAFWKTFAPLAAFAADVRARFEAELRRRRALTFATMLSRLAERVRADGGAASLLAQRVRERFDAVLVDEFQDTDDAQWTLLEAAFRGHTRLFLIGDPKQAIYGFRGADVQVYLRAGSAVEAERKRTMRDNWRSDEPAVRAMNHLWREGSGAFEEDGIDYVEVTAKKPVRLVVPDGPADALVPGLAVRWVDGRLEGEPHGTPLGAKDMALLALLASEEVLAWLRGERSALLEDGVSRLPLPRDFAVLVNDRYEAKATRDALTAIGVPSVAASRDTVFDSDVAAWLASWLDAVAAAGADREARTAVVTPLFGWRADQLAWSLEIASRGRPAEDAARAAGVADVPRWERWTSSLRKASEAWATRGFARTFDRAAADWDVLPRLLSQPEGERHATDLRHLFELAHAAERANRLGPGALAEWLRAQGAASEEGAKQRLESDDDAVRIVTIHTSKGLEYPIVLLPFAGLVPSSEDKGYPIVLRRESPPRVDLSPARSSARAVAVRAAEEEARREAMRKAYVALTRARHQTVLWYGPIGREGKSVSASPYGRLLLRDPAAATLDDARLPDFKADPAAAWEETRARLDALCATSGDTIAWVGAERPGALGLWEPAASAPAPVVTRAEWPESRGALEGRWIVASYTALSRGSAAPASTPDLDERSRHDDATLVGLLDGEAMQLDSSERDWSERDGSERDGSERDGSERDSSDLDRPQLARPQTAPRVRGTAAGSLDAAAPSGVDAQAPFALARPAELAFDDYAEPRLSLGRGTRYGSFVHEVFEALDFETGLALDGSDLAPRVAELARAQGLPRDGRQADELVQQLPRLLRTPLGSESSESPLRGLPADFTLAQLGRRDRLDELAFDLRLGAGTRYRRVESNASSRGDTTYAREGVSADGIAADGEAARLLARPGCVEPAAVYAALARETCTDGVADWLRFQRHRAAQGRALVGSSAGVLTGSIDLVFRVRDGDEHRYFLSDYKTNKIEGSSPGHYARAWMAWKMAEAGYPLQALLYTLALHRHLRLRLGPERYDYDRHLGGYLYLFVRGMAGPSTPRDVDGGHCLGVFAHRWSKETVEALDLALAPEDSP